MRFASLGSGSEGNGLLVESAGTRILADCGFGLADTVARLARLGIAAESIDAILVTHEHDDHVGGVARFARKFKTPVWLTYGTLQASISSLTGIENVRVFDCAQKFAIDAIEVEPYTVPHDAREPSQFVFSDGDRRLGLLTDAGSQTPHMVSVLDNLDAIILECNHDPELLQNSSYPERLKQRIGGRFGHLSNGAAADLLASLSRDRLRHVIAAHLSQKNNTPELARAALAGALSCETGWVGVADQANGFEWREI
ncbi:MAG: MBL fold metallo-hydrolase [Betaproteobacteria bacterium]|nr:MBL fold metallo-hydrolase [Betaproteobacteria bacterium]